MQHRDDALHDVAGAHPRNMRPVVDDRCWARDVVSAVRCATALLGMLFLIDWAAGDLTWWRGVLWVVLAVLLFLVLLPARVRAGEGWLSCRRLVRTREVRTDLLVSVHCPDSVSRRLVLRDALGGRTELDPQVLLDNPALWHRLDEDARKSAASGTLRCGTTALRRVSEHIDRETALNVFRASGLR
ncbi:hypothetical protein [Streptomyces sp. NPDC046805]|uniref:hypothetical protein n=1 Tax=Streptomyces sp. NPDC046805 TaxID=3155134 RepID=UPI003406366B